jgi:nucleoside-diphosphate-sugar epimerase
MEGPDDALASTIVGGTAAVLEAAQACGVRTIVYVSSAAVYGGGDLVDVDESRPRRPGSVYAASKARAEDAVALAAREGRIASWILRPCTLYGGGDRHFTRYLLELATGGVIPLVRGGAVRLDFLAATDLAEACLLALRTAPAAPAPVVNVASGMPSTVTELVARVRTMLGLPARTIVVEDPLSPPLDVPAALVAAVSEHRTFSIRRGQALLGFEPRSRFPEGLAASPARDAGLERSPTHVA